ncbi:PRD domain-containing protein [Corynebacterium renale]|uniref:PRD domain-containing protein n=1 Tax=Corynebacterium renale TaxID=1724 RepID=UPI000E049C64|nr:PRD domain-containing protein [Corynebacterium renale]STC99286.1 putative transcription antiterminator [Corynebacterium renale]
MHILRVFNNNVVLARRGDEEVIVTGRGLGFQAKSGDELDPQKVQKVFVPSDGRDPDHLAIMLAQLPGSTISLVNSVLEDVGAPDSARNSITFVVAVADHIDQALRRTIRGEHISYPLEAEVRHLYPEELERARQFVAAFNDRQEAMVALPDSEAIALALHFVSTSFTTGDLSFTYKMTGLIEQIIDVISSEYGVELDTVNVSVARFITHLRYLFVRIAQEQQLADEAPQIAAAINEAYAREASLAGRLAFMIELRFNTELTPSEVSYLTLHIARMAGTPTEL